MKSLTLIIALSYLLNLPLSYAEQIIDVDTKAVEYSQAELEQIFYYAPISFASECVDSVRSAAEQFGYSMRDMVAGAGHDACYLAGVTPTSMVFIPCIDGISHNEVEDAKPEWITAGTNVTLQAVLDKAIVCK